MTAIPMRLGSQFLLQIPRWIGALLILAGFAALSLPAQAQEAAPPPLAAYGALPDVEDAAISPDGGNFALITTIGGERLILFVGPDMQLMRKMELGDAKVRSMDWIGNDRILLLTSRTADMWGFHYTKTEAYDAHIVPATFDGEVETIFHGNSSIFDAVIGSFGTRRTAHGWKAYFGAMERIRGQRGGFPWRGRYLYEIDVATGSPRRIANRAAGDQWRDWVMAADGSVAATLDVDRDSGRWILDNGSGQRLAEGQQASARVGLLGLGYAGDSVLYSEMGDDGEIAWWEVPLAGGEATPFLPDVSVDRLLFDEASGRLLGYRAQGGGITLADPAHQQALEAAYSTFSASSVSVMDWSADFGKVLLRTSGNGDSGTWFIVDLGNKRANAIAFERAAIDRDRVGPVSRFEYVAGDGLELDGILTLPPGAGKKDLPLVVLPHGGPHSHDSVAFDWWAQAYASRGYAVFQPNFRGSTNRDQAFVSAGYGEWGRKMQTDISDGVAALAEAGIVDPGRACIVGASYGGYAALAGVTLQSGIYRCAVAVAPVSHLGDLYTYGYQSRRMAGTRKNALLEQLGPKSGWDAVSPRLHADRASSPILLIHGRDDTVVPFSHSKEMADRLADHGKSYRLVELKGEDHWLSLSETRQRMLEESVAFVEKHNPAN